jgi:hypothetical protein
LEIQHAVELLLLIPGNSFSAALRRQAVDTLLRVEGGDLGLIDRILAQRRFQAYLTESCPDHPLLASIRDYIGEDPPSGEVAKGEETGEERQETDSEQADAPEEASEAEKIEEESQERIATVQAEAALAPKEAAGGQERELQRRISIALAEKAEAEASMAKANDEKTRKLAEIEVKRAQIELEKAQSDAHLEKLQKRALMRETLLGRRATTQLEVARALDGLGVHMDEELQNRVSDSMLTSLLWPPCPDETFGEGLALHDYLESKMGEGAAAMRDVELDEFIISKVKDRHPDLVIGKTCLFRNKRPIQTDILYQGLKHIMDQAFEEYMKKTTADKEKET